MKLFLPSHETIRVKLFDNKAKAIEEYKTTLTYSPYSIKMDQNVTSSLIFTFTDLETSLMIPSSRIIVVKNGLPLMFNSTSGSSVKNKFKTDSIEDVNLKIQDRVGKIETLAMKENTLGSRLIERTWTEKIMRIISIRNETGRDIKNLIIEINDDPAHKITFQQADPAPSEINLPAHIWKLNLNIDEVKKINIFLNYAQKEQLKIQPQKISNQDVGIVESNVQDIE